MFICSSVNIFIKFCFRFSDSEREAIECKMQHRYGGDDGMPALYNPRRLFERPLPLNLQSQNDAVNEMPDQNDDHEMSAAFADDAMLPNGPLVELDEQVPNQNEAGAIVELINGDILLPNANVPLDGIGDLDEQMPNQNEAVFACTEVVTLPNESLHGEQSPNHNNDGSIDDAGDDIMPIEEHVDVVIIDSDDENLAPVDSKPDILPRVKVENGDMAAIEIILNNRANQMNAVPVITHGTEPIGVGVPGTSGVNAVTAATGAQQEQTGPSGLNEIACMKTPPKPRRAKLESDDFSGRIPYALNVCLQTCKFCLSNI